MSILVGTTLAAFVMDDEDTWGSWLRNAEAIRAAARDEAGVHVSFFAAVETDGRGLDPFIRLLTRLNELGGETWQFDLDDGRRTVTTANRLRHITMGQNLVTDRAVSDRDCSHLLFMATDTQAPDDVIPRLLELDEPFCAPFIPTYNLRGPETVRVVKDGAGWKNVTCEHAMPSAACVMLARQVFNRLRWRYDPVAGFSDDPAYHHDATTLLGIEPVVRMDCIARHFPETIGAVETRGHDMTVVR